MNSTTTDTASPVSAAELLALAERCEKASGPDCGLDCAIAVAVDWRWDGWEDSENYPALSAARHGLPWVIQRATMSHNSVFTGIPAYTLSLDAAMMLVPDDYDWAVFHTNGGLTFHAWCGTREDVFGYTPALALAVAALRARAQEITHDHQ